jgi:threonine-phosphate decarboxylase
MIHGHGGNIFDLARRLGCDPGDILDMSSNVNPLGPPPGLLDYLGRRLAAVTALPEADAGGAVAAFSARHGVAQQRVVGGNGSTQFIYILPRVLHSRRVLILGPTYADYRDACVLCGAVIEDLLAGAQTGFAFSPDDIDRRLRGGVDTAFICNPNNPTGVLIPAEVVETLCRRHRDVWFVVDESYLPFVENGDSQSLTAAGHPNLVVLNSMSKVFRVPGLRIGFAVAPEPLAETLRSHVMPWSVNALAQAAVLYLMTREPEIKDFLHRTREFFSTERGFWVQRLSAAPGLTPFAGQASFVLVRLNGGMTAERLCAELAAERILIRDCANFHGLSNRYVRVSLKNPQANRLLAQRMLEIDDRHLNRRPAPETAAEGGVR